MLEFDSPFRKRVRSLKSPNSPAFDVVSWKRLLETTELTDADLELCLTAFWIAGQAMALRKKMDQEPLPMSSGRLSTVLAVAMLNREYFILTGKLGKAQRAALDSDMIVATHQLADVPIGGGDGVFKLDAASLVDATTDAVDSWLYEAADVAGGMSDHPNLAAVAVKNAHRLSLQRAHYDLWQQALWEDWRLSKYGPDGRNFLFAPADTEVAALLDACLTRKESNFMEYAWIDASAWPKMSAQRRREIQLPLTVVAVDRQAGKRRRFVVGRPSAANRHVPAFVVSCSGLDGTYLAPFLERPLPVDPDLTCELILRAWYVLLDLAEVLAKQRPRATFHDLDNVRNWACVVWRNEVVDVLHRALAIKQRTATKIVNFLSWAKDTYKGLWGAPLVPLPGSAEHLLIAHSVLATSNVVRRVEIWLTKGGLDDNLARADHAIKKSANFPEQIDVLVQFASLLLVGEVKCLLSPADSRERYNFLRTLKDAAAQATRKAAAIAQYRDVAAQVLGIPETKVNNLRVLPLVVTNQGFGISLVFDGCIVIDAKFLKLYLGSGKYVSEAAFNCVDGSWAHAERYLYRSAAEAVDNFEKSMRRPPPLYRFVDQLHWTTFEFPTLSGNSLLITRTEYGNLSDETRSRYQALHAAVENH
jgi:hypothetical protein